jgi:cytochrome c oxidase assembly protein subunit 15
MVASGLVDRPEVSQYRLVLHLLLALAIYAYLLRVAFAVLRPAPPRLVVGRGLRRAVRAVTALAVLTIAMGGFVAGLDAGYIYNTFPLMGGRLVPADAFAVGPYWIQPFENPAAAQFVHRWLAVALMLACVALWAAGRRVGALAAVAAMAAAQGALGLATLLLVVPIPLAAAHQAGAVLLVGLLVWTLHRAAPEVLGAGPFTIAGRRASL